MFHLKNKIAIITGAGSGIGRATALRFAKQGAEVHILDIQKSMAVETAAAITEANGIAHVHECDVTSMDSVKQVFQQINHVDILVNSAGLSHIGNVENTLPTDMDRVYNVNVKGTFHCIQAAIPLMKRNKSGVILNLASIAGNVGIPDRFAYSMSKGAVIGMTLSVAKDYIGDGIRCNCISPARVHTAFVDGFLKKNYPGREAEMFQVLSKTQPIGRMATPEEIAACILYLCSDEAAFVTGCDYPVDGGFIKLNN